MDAIAKTKHLKGSPRKTRLVIDMIRGRRVSSALAILKFTDKRAAQPIAKCLNSAIANATYLAEQDNIAVDPDDLWVRKCFVDMGPTKNRRRMRPAPQGRAYREQRHYCHITIQVTSEEQPKTEKELKAEAAKAKRAETGKAKVKSQKAKSTAPTETKEAKAEKIEEVATSASEEVATTPSAEAAATPPKTGGELETTLTANEVAAELTAKGDAEVADAKNVQSQTPAEANETQLADEAQQKINEDVERQ